ncbi:hypothetical protein CYY_004356 [Polysphondylium violaceum]|uniref:Chitinase domain-containing protein 1 n=1 Tax=Polysphondylium violaceum TaxID=133409 RepID=A0A8J4PVE1_9MYCE|nr:hypothetical protein CYY_004356 [Polysphondylium violaceum]
MKININYILFVVVILVAAIAVVSSQETFTDDEESLLTSKDVRKRNLIRENIKPTVILKNANMYYKDTSRKSFKSNTLAYITPWNSKGYQIAETFKHKFTHLSPVWYQIKYEKSSFLIEGDHNVDKGWVDRVRDGSKTKVLPRFAFEGNAWNTNTFETTLKNQKFINSLIETLKKHNFDGLVLEGIIYMTNRDVRNKFLETLAEKLHALNKELIIVITPISQDKSRPPLFNEIDFAMLSKTVDGFSLMTYDYAPSQGANAPKQWVEDNIKIYLSYYRSDESNPEAISQKLFVGIPFYGYKVSMSKNQQQPSPVVGHEYLKLLKSNKDQKIIWNDMTQEHSLAYFDKGVQTVVTYPSLLFIDQRIQLAKEYKVSISIWEIGQGLDYFYDLL